jgi:hypothetical protein
LTKSRNSRADFGGAILIFLTLPRLAADVDEDANEDADEDADASEVGDVDVDASADGGAGVAVEE